MKTKKLKTIQNIKIKKRYNNDSNMTISQTEVKPVVGKRRNKKLYLCPCPVESYDRVDGLYTLRSSHDGCRCILTFFIPV